MRLTFFNMPGPVISYNFWTIALFEIVGILVEAGLMVLIFRFLFSSYGLLLLFQLCIEEILPLLL
jgi:hypothetical protein